jgi:hypothetical protein
MTVTTEQQQGPEALSTAGQLAVIEKRLARIQLFTDWMVALMAFGLIAGVIIGLIIASRVGDVVNAVTEF